LCETLDRGWQPHRLDGPTPRNSDAAPVNVDAGKLKLGDQAGRELDPRAPKLVIRHRFPGAAGEDAQQMHLLIVKRRTCVRRSALVRLHIHVPNLRCRELGIVQFQPIMRHRTDLSETSGRAGNSQAQIRAPAPPRFVFSLSSRPVIAMRLRTTPMLPALLRSVLYRSRSSARFY
jgi:hypothetical protein